MRKIAALFLAFLLGIAAGGLVVYKNIQYYNGLPAVDSGLWIQIQEQSADLEGLLDRADEIITIMEEYGLEVSRIQGWNKPDGERIGIRLSDTTK